MDYYREMYKKNWWRGNDVSILKTCYASFKMKQIQGNALEVDEFMDVMMKAVKSTSRFARPYEFIPFGYRPEYKRSAKFISLRREDVRAFLLQDNVPDKAFEDLLYGTDKTLITMILLKEKNFVKVRERIKKYYFSDNKNEILSNDINMQLGDRIFGYLLNVELMPSKKTKTKKECLSEWYKFMGEDFRGPSNCKLIRTPNLNRSKNSNDNRILLKHLQTILDFYREIGLIDVVVAISKDIDKLSSPPK